MEKFYSGKELRIPSIYNSEQNIRRKTNEIAKRVSKAYKGWKFVFARMEKKEKSDNVYFTEFIYILKKNRYEEAKIR